MKKQYKKDITFDASNNTRMEVVEGTGIVLKDVEGLYEGGWMSDQLRVELLATQSIEGIIISGLNPQDIMHNVEAKLKINNVEIGRKILPSGEFEWKINFDNCLKDDFKFVIETDKFFIPDEIGDGQDTRKLSIVIVSIYLSAE